MVVVSPEDGVMAAQDPAAAGDNSQPGKQRDRWFKDWLMFGQHAPFPFVIILAVAALSALCLPSAMLRLRECTQPWRFSPLICATRA